VFAKVTEPPERNWIVLFEDSGSGGCWFNIATGDVGTAYGTATGRTKAYKDGFYRCWITLTQSGTTGRYRIGLATNNAVNVYAGNGTSGAFLWGAQLELGAFPTSYIPNLTTGTTTRNADVVSMTGTNFSSWYNATEGSVAAEASLLPGTLTVANRRVFWFDNSATSQYANAWQATAQPASSLVDFQIVSSSALQSRMQPSNTFTEGQILRIASAMKTSGSASAILGGTVSAVATATLPVSLDTLRIGNHRDGTYLNGWMRSLSYWKQRLINAEVQAFSKR
jgi:hypothetical protein